MADFPTHAEVQRDKQGRFVIPEALVANSAGWTVLERSGLFEWGNAVEEQELLPYPKWLSKSPLQQSSPVYLCVNSI